jgi:hypothetical protein
LGVSSIVAPLYLALMQSHVLDVRLRNRPGRITSLAAALCALAAVCGCVQRRLTIRSNPPGARVYVGDEEIGTTPVSTDFVYYGTRKIRLVKDGFETMVVNQPIPAPWYQIPPLDLVSENLIPGEIRDERVVSFQLVPLQPVSTDQFLARAGQLRSSSAPPMTVITPSAVSPGVPNPIPGVSAAPETLPEPAAPLQGIGPPPGGAIPVPPTNLPAVPAVPPAYNPPQYLPPG